MGSGTLAGMKQRILSSIAKTSAFEIATLESAETPYSVDILKLAGSPRDLRVAVKAYQYLFRSENLSEIRRIAGVSPAGETFASLLCYLERKPLLLLGAMGPPPQRRITGLLQPGESVLLVDGVCTHATLVDAAKAIEAEGGLVNHALVLVGDAHAGSAAEPRIKVHALLSVSEIIDYMGSRRPTIREQATFPAKDS